jgi:hypothetical protein
MKSCRKNIGLRKLSPGSALYHKIAFFFYTNFYHLLDGYGRLSKRDSLKFDDEKNHPHEVL